MEFLTNLIVVKKEQSVNALKSLKINCTRVDNWCWIFEGELWVLEEDGVKFNIVESGAVPCLGDMTRDQLVKICENRFEVDIYKQNYCSSRQ